jgi:hypothetical protein
MDLLKIIIILFIIVVVFVFTKQYLYSKQKVYEGFNSGCLQGEPCPKGCNQPTKVSLNCSNIFKDDDGKCYKLCDYECTDPLSECAYDECCSDCGKVKVYVDCKTGKELNKNDDLNEPSQESNYSASSINKGITNTSKNDIQGSLLSDDEYDNNVVANTMKTSLQATSQNQIKETNGKKNAKNSLKNNDVKKIVEYHNHYYGLILPEFILGNTQKHENTLKVIDAVSNNVNKKTPNPYRQGGNISKSLADQTASIEKSLSFKAEPSSIMNYGAYGTQKTHNTSTIYKNKRQPLSVTGMYDDNTPLGFNSLYSLHF